jgi:hypothetical protein
LAVEDRSGRGVFPVPRRAISPQGVMDALPVTLLGPKTEVVVAGFQVRRAVRHCAPRAAGTKKIEDAVEHAASGILARTGRRGGK